METLWGIDLGGTKIEGTILNHQKADEPLCRIRIPTEPERGYAHVLDQIARLCEQMQQATGLPLPERVGMGTPGVTDPKTGLLKNANTQCLNGQPLEMAVSERLGTRVVTANDANCFALAEATLGAARGTLEALIAGPALETFYKAQSGAARSLSEIVQRARNGTDVAATATLERLTTIFVRAITMVVDLFDPHAIVLGGGVGNIDELYSPAMRTKIEARIFNATFDTPILKPQLGDSAGVFGAAMLVV